MNKKEFEKAERHPVSKNDFEKALKNLVLAPANERPRAENREPTMKELNQRFKLERR